MGIPQGSELGPIHWKLLLGSMEYIFIATPMTLSYVY